ncbi:unnamed protein product [Vitrella brassicaformis CCMP3155]|uniref:Uncharacterized protein n=1 Tax=Vitrella brassicaformis (strain CCMP3155) TaxID=1169540 RepID=A0A0G4GS38_VITBC|nr:unnamed protein product [Vitrella brassicaformis CCMP3155]|eukprot:CEM33181.1 unnamed protein product [Vitrella brassicaformis CCMP3155]
MISGHHLFMSIVRMKQQAGVVLQVIDLCSHAWPRSLVAERFMTSSGGLGGCMEATSVVTERASRGKKALRASVDNLAHKHRERERPRQPLIPDRSTVVVMRLRTTPSIVVRDAHGQEER